MKKHIVRISLLIAAVVVLASIAPLVCKSFATPPSRGVGTSSGTGEDSNVLFGRTASYALQRGFSDPRYSYLLIDLRSDTRIAENWQRSDRPIPVGSLVKPFTAVAYGESHNFHFPELKCSGAGACWRPQGHGELGIVHAIAFSCNAYFKQLAESLSSTQASEVAHRFGLNGPGAGASAEAMAGKYGVWRESPDALARAYSELLARRSQPGIREIVAGMAESAKIGTAEGIAQSVLRMHVLAKTGTAPCAHPERAPGDGLALVSWPADSPRYLLLVRVHGKPGAQAATLAGQMLRALEPQH